MGMTVGGKQARRLCWQAEDIPFHLVEHLECWRQDLRLCRRIRLYHRQIRRLRKPDPRSLRSARSFGAPRASRSMTDASFSARLLGPTKP
jgi:hypothetical protein